MKHSRIWVHAVMVAAVCLVSAVFAQADTIATQDYWVLKDGYIGEFTNNGQLAMSYGSYSPYIAAEVFDIDWPGSTGTTDQFFNYSSGKLIYYGARFVDSSEWMYVPDAPQEFLPAVVETGRTYTCTWSRREYQNGVYKGNGRDSYTITIKGPIAITVPAGTYTTYQFNLTNNWQTSTGGIGTTVYTYYLAQGTGWVRLIRDNVTSELLRASPTAVTGAATNVTTTSATLNGTVNPRGASTTVVFEYGTTAAYGKQIPAVQSPLTGATDKTVSAQVTALTDGTLYHFRVKAVNSKGTVWGADRTFTTDQELPPTVKTHYPSNVTLKSATLNAEVNPNGAESTWHFKYGTSDACDKSTPNQSGGSGSASLPVTRSLTGLTPDTTYYYRIAAENSRGDSLGAIQTFRTTVMYVEPFGACGGHTPCYGSIQHAADAAVYGGTVKIADDDFYEDLEPGTWGNLILQGGWNASFSSRSAISPTSGTAIDGSLLIGADMAGAVVIDGLVLGAGADPSTYTNSLGMTFKLLPSGTFTMGSPSDEPGRDSDEGPQHQVTLTQPFYMQTTEVTQTQWEAVMGSNPSSFKDCPTCPVEEVSWNDVQTFITEMNKRGEGTYSLPTEAQWEYAARAGSATAFYNGGITKTDCSYDPNLDKIGWYCYNSSDKTHPVAQKTPNAWGLYDMSGNVCEWCQDWFSSSYYSSSPASDPSGPSSGSGRVRRGGHWRLDASYCRSADRGGSYPDYRAYVVGFRLLRQP